MCPLAPTYLSDPCLPETRPESVAHQQLSIKLAAQISQCARFPEICDVYSKLMANANYRKIE
jgi:hypothetical protein